MSVIALLESPLSEPDWKSVVIWSDRMCMQTKRWRWHKTTTLLYERDALYFLFSGLVREDVGLKWYDLVR